MNHLIIGSGVIGSATGEWLEAHREYVAYSDKNIDVLHMLEKKEKNIFKKGAMLVQFDIIWVCTAEWNVDEVMEDIKDFDRTIVIRSTIKPTILRGLSKRYPTCNLAHIPEFLREKTALQDIFNAERIVVGTIHVKAKRMLKKLFRKVSNPIFFCTPEESSLIKLTANNWLALQVSFWNNMKELFDTFKNVDSQFIADTVTLDSRISKYGSALTGMPFSGFCFPKDTKALEEVFEERKVKPTMIRAMRKENYKECIIE